MAFKYAPFGQRMQKIAPGVATNHLYDGADFVEEIDATGTLLARYAQGTGPDEHLAELRSGTAAYLIKMGWAP